MDKTWPVCIRIPKGGKWQYHPHTAYQYIWQMDHTLPEGSHELHMQEADCGITETEVMKGLTAAEKMGLCDRNGGVHTYSTTTSQPHGREHQFRTGSCEQDDV